MNLTQFPRRRYTPYKTPIEYLKNLSEALGGPNIYIKRDDLLGLAAGGNKTRKLEFLMADALKKGCDTVMTDGAVQSNHCRLTLAAAVKEGIKCQLIIEECVKDSYRLDAGGNNYLFRLLGVEKIHVVPGGTDADEALEKLADELRAQGRKPYPIPVGGSNAIGALGYIACANEILDQSFEMGINLDRVICPCGSAGTHTGLIYGFEGSHANLPVTGISVSGTVAVQTEKIKKLIPAIQELPGMMAEISDEAIHIRDEYVGPGYSLPTESMGEAVRLVARTEAILLDPVYTGKAMAGLIDMIRKGELHKGQNVLFLHTGGSPVLYEYQKATLGE